MTVHICYEYRCIIFFFNLPRTYSFGCSLAVATFFLPPFCRKTWTNKTCKIVWCLQEKFWSWVWIEAHFYRTVWKIVNFFGFFCVTLLKFFRFKDIFVDIFWNICKFLTYFMKTSMNFDFVSNFCWFCELFKLLFQSLLRIFFEIFFNFLMNFRRLLWFFSINNWSND